MFIEVIPEAKSYKSDSFTYGVPAVFRSLVKIGSIVQVPFGKKKIKAVVTVIKQATPTAGYPIKDIISVNPEFSIPPSYLSIIDWLAEYYYATCGEALSLFMPPEMKRPPQGKISRVPDAETLKQKLNKLSSAQDRIYSDISQSGASKPHLIYGVTGSGKTEIYLHLAADALSAGRSVVILVPEIILTPQTVDRFREVLGDSIALLHSGLSAGEKYTAYKEFFTGSKRVIIGPRSALLVPNNNIGLIIIDEEHEEAYKQESSPRYHAIHLAEQIASEHKAILVLGSATPRLESFYKTSTGEYILHQMSGRYNKLLLPPAEIIDLRNELRSGNSSVISLSLSAALKKTLTNKKQAILFINRRGASTFVSCRECGFVIRCPNCGIPMIHHSAGGDHLYCHHCDFRAELPAICPDCHGVKIKYFGAGVEKVESEVKAFFPGAKVRRIDATTVRNKGDYETFYHDFKQRKFDIAIGTQMITKGLNLPHVDLVGIISADTGLHMPYFRANEKIFRLVTQVSGRSGRAENPGQTVIQTYWPESGAIKFAANHDFEGFYEFEIAQRQIHHYPPFCNLLRIVSEDENPQKAKNNLLAFSAALDKLSTEHPDAFSYIGPGLCFFQRLRNRWRYHIIVKLKNEKNGEEQRTKLMKSLRDLWKKNLNLIWDIDPSDLL